MKNGLPILKKIYISCTSCIESESESEKKNLDPNEKYFFLSATLVVRFTSILYLPIEGTE
jgi:hypothetical protein